MNNNVNAELRKTIHALFENSSPIRVEVRFPNMGASPDWRLCEDQEQFDQLLERLAPPASKCGRAAYESCGMRRGRFD
jgi:hypothetical protein